MQLFKDTTKNPLNLPPSKVFVIDGGSDSVLWGDINSTKDDLWQESVWKAISDNITAKKEEINKLKRWGKKILKEKGIIKKSFSSDILQHYEIRTILEDVTINHWNNVEESLKHPGHNPQSVHGHRGSGHTTLRNAPENYLDNFVRSNDRRNLDRMMPNKNISPADFIYSAYEYADEATGLSSKVRSMSINNHGETVINGDILNKEKNAVIGEFSRVTQPTGEIFLRGMSLKPQVANQGFGTRFAKNQEDAYVLAGFTEIHTEAQKIGGYTLAKMGYSIDDNGGDAIAAQGRGFMSAKTAFSDYHKSIYGSEPSGKYDTTWDMASYQGDDGRNIGKEFMVNSKWKAIKLLNPSNEGYIVGLEYLNSK